MYGYHETLTKEEIFLKVNQEEIFKHVFGNFQTGEYIQSPFRNDDSPGCWIQWHNGKLYFTDFASSTRTVNLDMIGVIQLKYNLSFKEAIDFIANFRCSNEPEYPKYNKVFSNTNSTLIEFCPKPFDDYHKTYWSQYEITSSQLIQDNIFATKWYKIKDSIFYPFPAETTYAISYPMDEVKICRPKVKANKWFTNTTKNTIGGTKSLPFLDKNLIISKSYKDWRVLTNLGFNVIYFQNEGMFPDMENLDIYIRMFDNVYVLFDNDKTGIEASKKLTDYINSEYSDKSQSLLLPTTQKDPADAIKEGNKEQLINYLNFLNY